MKNTIIIALLSFMFGMQAMEQDSSKKQELPLAKHSDTNEPPIKRKKATRSDIKQQLENKSHEIGNVRLFKKSTRRLDRFFNTIKKLSKQNPTIVSLFRDVINDSFKPAILDSEYLPSDVMKEKSVTKLIEDFENNNSESITSACLKDFLLGYPDVEAQVDRVFDMNQ